MPNLYWEHQKLVKQANRAADIEFGRRTISQSGPIVGICTENGVLLASQNSYITRFMDLDNLPSMLYKTDGHTLCAVTGMAGDADMVMKRTSLYAHQFLMYNCRPIPSLKLVRGTSEALKSATLIANTRPLGIAILWAHHHRSTGFELYSTELNGDYSRRQYFAFGRDADKKCQFFQQFFKDREKLNLTDAKEAALKAFASDGELVHPLSIQMGMITQPYGLTKVKIVARKENVEYFKDAKVPYADKMTFVEE